MYALYSLYDALISISVPADKARAVVSALEQDMVTVLATKADLNLLNREVASTRDSLKQEIELLRSSVKQEIELLRSSLNQESSSLRQEMELLRSSMTIRLGTMLALGLGLLFAALKLT